jgi:hypothetical protein
LFSAIDPTYVQFKILQGGWQARGFDEKGLWLLTIELRENANSPGQFFGYTTFVCRPIGPPASSNFGPNNLVGPNSAKNLARIIRDMTPRSMVLSAVPADGALSFKAEKILGAADCPFTRLVLTRWGATGLMAEWQFGECSTGSSVLMRDGR